MATLTAEDVESKLREHGGNMAAVGRALGVTRQAVFDFVKRRKTLLAVVLDCRESFKDDAETSLQQAVRAGQAWAVCFYLKTQAKDRGYIERQETRAITDDDIDRAIEAELEAVAGKRQAGDAGEAQESEHVPPGSSAG